MTRFVIAALCVSSLAASCAPHAPEQTLLEQFFQASRLRDRTALQQISTVVFEPREQGTVSNFTITGVAEAAPPAGQDASKQVTLEAPVRLPDGGTATRTIVVVLQKHERWIVTGFTMAAKR